MVESKSVRGESEGSNLIVRRRLPIPQLVKFKGDADVLQVAHTTSLHFTTELMASQDFASRPINKLVLFDVDGTLTPARQVCSFMFGRMEPLYEHSVSVSGDVRIVERTQKESCNWFCWWFRSGQDHGAA
jgi:hypothetical protein